MLETLYELIVNNRLFAFGLGFLVAFGILSRVMPCNKDYPFLRFGSFINDMGYFLIMPFANRFVHIFLFALGIYVVFQGQTLDTLQDEIKYGFGPATTLPIWVQIAIIFIFQDIFLYWMHRLFHTGKLWPYHAIHHSSKHVDWHSTYRFHPLNSWSCFVMADAIVLVSGFSPAALASLAIFNMCYSAMVHANLNWTFGPFKYVFASPVFHRWHHTTQREGLNKNFAPTFPLLDIVFGTFYMPDGKLPKTYGVHGADIPESFLGQLVWPFKQKVPAKAQPPQPKQPQA